MSRVDSSASARDGKGVPAVATLLTWFLPGAGHVYLGRISFGLIAFVVLEGLYALGYLLSDGRSFQVLDPELQGPFATALSPEVGNLGAMIWQLKTVGFQAQTLSPFPSTLGLGGMLTGISGILNVCLMVHAHLTARTTRAAPRKGPSPVAYVLATWICPGLGHVLQGRVVRGAIVFTLLVGLFLWGTWLAEGSNLSRERHFYYWAGQFLVGLPALLTEVVSGRPPVSGEIRFLDVGLLFACMPGLLNILAMLDVYGVAEGRWLGEKSGAAGGTEA